MVKMALNIGLRWKGGVRFESYIRSFSKAQLLHKKRRHSKIQKGSKKSNWEQYKISGSSDGKRMKIWEFVWLIIIKIS